MAIPTFRGSFANFLQDQVWDFDPQRGLIYRAGFRGISQANMIALQETYIGNGIACRLTFHVGDTCSLEIEDATQAYTIDTWQIVGNQESRDGLSHPTLWNGMGAGTDTAKTAFITKMRQHLENNDDPTTLFASGGDFYGAPAIIQKFYLLMARGSTEYFRGQYVLRHTTNTPNRWTVNISDIGIDQIYTPSQLLTETQDTALWQFPLPGRLAYKLAAIPVPTAQTDHLWGWLKKASTETTAANNRVDIATEYILEQWPSSTYYEPKT